MSRDLQTSGRKGIWQREQSRKELRKSEQGGDESI